jgi:hypothetical protein
MSKRSKSLKAASNRVQTFKQPPYYTIGGMGTKLDPGVKTAPPKCFKAGRMNIIANQEA